MTVRRIELALKPPHEPLKQVAGLIQKLSYRDMEELADKLNKRISGTTTSSDVAASLLLVCDQILSPAVPQKDQGGSSSAEREVYRR